MNVLQVLLVTTIVYFIAVTIWVMKIEDILEESSERRVSEGGGR